MPSAALHNRRVQRLTALDTSFLHLEEGGAHMHVAEVFIFDGSPPSIEEFTEHVVGRLDLVPRYRQRLAEVPLGQGRPVWVDDPHFNPSYHIRHAGLPPPGDENDLRRLAGRLFSQRLDRTKPLWEVRLVEGLAGRRFALLTKTHHSLVDGLSGLSVTSVLFDTRPEPATDVGRPAVSQWAPRPMPTRAQLLGDALKERATSPGEALRGMHSLVRTPLQVAETALDRVGAILSGGGAAPPSPFNVPIGPHRRLTWIDADLDELRHVKSVFGVTVNDVLLAAVAGALGRYLRRTGTDTDELVLRALLPISVEGNEVAAAWAPLPVGIEDPRARAEAIAAELAGLSDTALAAQELIELDGFAPATIISQAARMQARQRYFNVVVTNVPGPQMPLYLLGRRLDAIYPVVPLAANQALGVAIVSYMGRLGFGLLGDFDALPRLEEIAADLEASIEELSVAAGPRLPRATRRRPAKRGPLPAAAGGNGGEPEPSPAGT